MFMYHEAEHRQAATSAKTSAVPVPEEPSVIENMLFPCILMKIRPAYQAKSLFTVCR